MINLHHQNNQSSLWVWQAFSQKGITVPAKVVSLVQFFGDARIGTLLHKPHASDLYLAQSHSFFAMYVLVSVNLRVATLTHLSIYLLAIACIFSYVHVCNMPLTQILSLSLSPNYIQVWPRLLSGSAGHPSQQSWLGFNAVVCVCMVLYSDITDGSFIVCVSLVWLKSKAPISQSKILQEQCSK